MFNMHVTIHGGVLYYSRTSIDRPSFNRLLGFMEHSSELRPPSPDSYQTILFQSQQGVSVSVTTGGFRLSDAPP